MAKCLKCNNVVTNDPRGICCFCKQHKSTTEATLRDELRRIVKCGTHQKEKEYQDCIQYTTQIGVEFIIDETLRLIKARVLDRFKKFNIEMPITSMTIIAEEINNLFDEK